MNITIRKGKSQDLIQIIDLISQFSVIRYPENPVHINVYDLVRDGFSIKKYFDILVAVHKNKIIGFSMYHNAYSFLGKGMFVDGIFIKEQYVKSGIGLSIFSKHFEIASNNNMNRLEWDYVEQFSSLKVLYKKAGAKILLGESLYILKKEDFINVSKPIEIKETYSIRKGTPKDMSQVFDLMLEISFLRNEKTFLSVKDLINDGFSKNPFFGTFILEVEDKIVGFILYYYGYSSTFGKTLNIGEVYIKNEYHDFMFDIHFCSHLIQFAEKENFNKISQSIKDNNPLLIKRATELGFQKEKGVKTVVITNKALNNYINN